MGDITPNWIAIDWGTSNLRVWALDDDGTVLSTALSSDGMGSLAPDDFEPALLALIDPWLTDGKTIPAIACGMVGARQGWIEADYAQLPCSPVGDSLTPAPVRDTRFSVSIIPGLCQSNPADVMRGEETQIAGFLANAPDFKGTLCLPGTHTKWVRIEDGSVTGFTTIMTGELFALLSRHSVLRHSVSAEGWNELGFLRGFDTAFAAPDSVTARLFSLRARSLLAGLHPDEARAELSGLLLGLELAACRDYWQHSEVGLIGTQSLCANYAKALTRCGANPKLHSGENLTLHGLTKAFQQHRKKTR